MRTVQVNHCLLCAELELPGFMTTAGGLQLGDSRSKESLFNFLFGLGYLFSWTVELLPHMRLPIWNSLGIPFLVKTSLKSDSFSSFTKFVE